MGNIIVGQEKQKVYKTHSLSLTKSDENAGNPTLQKIYTEEEKEKIINAIVGSLPKARIPAALRSAGLNEEADMYEKKFAEEEEQKRREVRLKEILALPESEQLPILLAEGYEEESKELSERLAEENAKNADNGDAGTAEKEQQDNGLNDSSEDADEVKSEEEVKEGVVEQPQKPVRKNESRKGSRAGNRKR